MAGKQIHNLVFNIFFLFRLRETLRGVKETKLTASLGTNKLVEIDCRQLGERRNLNKWTTHKIFTAKTSPNKSAFIKNG